MRYSIILAVSIFILFPAFAFPATLKVPSQYPTIQDAIDAASGGDTVLVEPGTYVENIDFKGKAITVTSEQGAGVTVIDAPYIGTVVVFQNGEGHDSVLEGFTIANGYSTIGGGILCDQSSPTILNNIVIGNKTTSEGGGMCNINSSPTVTNCTFEGNSPMGVHYTAGMCNTGNSNPLVTYCTFIDNKGSLPHTAVGMLNSSSSPIVTSCTFIKNLGCGMINLNSSPVVSHCIFIENEMEGILGGNPIVTNCIFTENTGGGMGVSGNGTNATVCNCTFHKNSTGLHAQLESNTTITNSIFWDNGYYEIILSEMFYFFPTLTISYSDVKGGKSSVYVDPNCTLNWGAGMIDADPLFVDEANGDFHLTYPSPCKDTGDNSAITEPYDFEGDPRIAYGTVDMGADEFYTHLYWTGDATPGGNVEIKFVGLPGTTPVGLCIGTDVLDPPIPSMWGDWYLMFPIIGPVDLGSITSPEGVLIVPGTIPASPPPPYSIPMQSLIGMKLTNLCVLEVK
jgi:hypothetical protein